jgi:hypothetical protein
MAREENSLLFSLKELHKLEADRLQEEEDLRVADIEAKRQAQENAERAVRDAEEARIQAQKDAEKRAREEKERKEMEDRIHLEQAERQARIAAQEKIELNRLAAEAEAIRTKPINWKLIGAVASAVLMVSIVIVGAVKSNREKTAKQEIAALDAKLDAERRADRAETAPPKSARRKPVSRSARTQTIRSAASTDHSVLRVFSCSFASWFSLAIPDIHRSADETGCSSPLVSVHSTSRCLHEHEPQTVW